LQQHTDGSAEKDAAQLDHLSHGANVPSTYYSIRISQQDTNSLPEKRPFDVYPKEIYVSIVDPVILSLGVCRGHLDGDDRGATLEEYSSVIHKLVNCFNFSTPMASYALERFTDCHTLRLEAEKLDTMIEQTATTPLLVGQDTFPFPPKLLQHLTIFFKGGSLGNSNGRAFNSLSKNIRHIHSYFPNLSTLKIDIKWSGDGNKERFGPLFLAMLASGDASATDLPLIDIPSAHQTCERYLHLIFHLSQFCRRHDIEVEMLSAGPSAVLTGNWDEDLRDASRIFPNSAAWSPTGFPDWVAGYVETTYGEYVDREMLLGWPTEVHALNTERTLVPRSSHDYASWTLLDAVIWAAIMPGVAAQYTAARAVEKVAREAPLP
jgi:hypothetical protein